MIALLVGAGCVLTIVAAITFERRGRMNWPWLWAVSGAAAVGCIAVAVIRGVMP